MRAQLAYLDTTRKHFTTVIDEAEYMRMVEKGERRLSFKVPCCKWMSGSATARACADPLHCCVGLALSQLALPPRVLW